MPVPQPSDAPPLPPPLPPPPAPPRRSPLRWILFGIAMLFLAVAISRALDPYDARGVASISHGDHTHYVPRDRDPEAPISNFPTTPPGPNERILPDGRVVPLR